jgi:hypothetical protein
MIDDDAKALDALPRAEAIERKREPARAGRKGPRRWANPRSGAPHPIAFLDLQHFAPEVVKAQTPANDCQNEEHFLSVQQHHARKIVARLVVNSALASALCSLIRFSICSAFLNQRTAVRASVHGRRQRI